MKLLIAFFKDKTREISLYAGTVGIFIVVAFLYNIRMDALKYALLLVILWYVGASDQDTYRCDAHIAAIGGR